MIGGMRRDMKTRQIGVVITVVVVLVAFAGAALQNVGAAATQSADNELAIVSFSTDKDLYSAREEMTISLSLHAPEEISNASIEVTGVKSTKGVYYVQYASQQDLTAGANTITFTKKLPSCSRCAGISQGTYLLDASVIHDSKVVTATHSIAITSNPDQIIVVDLDVEEAKRMMESKSKDIILLDVRTVEEYDLAHINGALSIPIAELDNGTEKLNTSTKIIVYGGNGVNSTIACAMLIENGFERVYNVIGGLNAWEEQGYAVVSTETPGLKEPGFEVVLALVAGLIVAYRVRRR
jgi:rhodanese-related sulfurtransferase